MRAQRHANTNLAGPTSHGIGFHAVNADNCEQKGDYTKGTEKNRAEPDQPKSDAFFHKVDVGRDAKNGQIGVDVAQGLADRRNHSGDGMSIMSTETDMEKNIPVIAVGEGHEQPGQSRVILDVVAVSV